MSSAYFVRDSTDKPDKIYEMYELLEAIVDFIQRLADGESEHVELVFSA